MEIAAAPVEGILAKEYASTQRALIDPARAAVTDAPGDPPALGRRETTYLCAADPYGQMVSWIQSTTPV